jgi:uncharacterized protein YciI
MRSRSWPRLTCVLALLCGASVLRAQEPAPSAPPASPAPAKRTFALVFRTGPSWNKAKAPGAQAHFADHSANIRKLREEGRLLVGGRFSDQGLLIVEAKDEAEARTFVDRDPSVRAGTFTAEVHAWSTFAGGCVGRAN